MQRREELLELIADQARELNLLREKAERLEGIVRQHQLSRSKMKSQAGYAECTSFDWVWSEVLKKAEDWNKQYLPKDKG